MKAKVVMCGINGFNWNNVELIKKMNEKIKHRGPDDEGYYVDENVSMGHVRLSIIDLTVSGKQPMSNEDDSIKIVFNGEIYNYLSLRDILQKKGHSFKSHTDTEVILHAYEEWGEECVKRFNGMWAFAIYDSKKEIVFLSRDRFGIKPLYYFLNDSRLIFSSEIKSIFVHNIKREPNDAIIYDFMAKNLIDHTEETFFKGIKKLLPGHNLIYNLKNGNYYIYKYYDLKKELKNGTDNAEKKFKEIFLKSVKRRLIADVPVGSCLSGGLDSSSIVMATKKIKNKEKIHTFSLVFPGNKIDESKYQKIVVNNTGAIWHKTSFDDKELLNDINDLVYTQEEPFKTLSIYGQYRVMKLAKENKIKVLLDGQGSDEILAGYHWFFGYYFYELLSEFRIKYLFKEFIFYIKTYKSILPIKYLLRIFLQKGIEMNSDRYLNRSFITRFKNRQSEKPILEAKSINEISVIAETYFSLPYLLRLEDKNSMRWSIESRVPFCDHELVEYVCSLDSKYKIKDLWTKVILRKSLKKLLPKEIILRRDKIGFATPDDELLRTKYGKKLAYSIIDSEQFKSRKYWNWKKVKKMLDMHVKNNKNYGKIIWRIIIIELWLRMWIDEDSDKL